MNDSVRRWPKRVASVLGGLALVGLTIQACRKALRAQGCDLTCYLDGGEAAIAGTSPYDVDAYFEFLYPPLFAMEMAPLSVLPVTVAAVIWSLLSGLALVYAIRTVRYLAIENRQRHFDAHELLVLLALAAIGFRVVQSNFANGQVNLIVICLAAAFLSALQRGRGRTAAFWLALAVHAKVVPILLLGLLVVRGQWRTLLYTAGFGLALGLLPLLAWGANTIDIYQEWPAMIEHKLRTYTVDMGTFSTDAEGNREYFSLRGMLATLWPSTSPSQLAKYGCMAMVFGVTMLVDRCLVTCNARAATTAGFVLWLMSALLVAPMSEKHHLALLLPAAAFGLYATIDGDRRCRLESLGWAGCLAAIMMLSKPMPSGPFNFLAIVIAYAWVVRAAYSPGPGQHGGFPPARVGPFGWS